MITFTDRRGTLIIAAIEYADATDRAMMLEQCAPEGRAALKRNLDVLDARERAFQAAATPEQTAITWGDYWMATFPVDIPGVPPYVLLDSPVTVYGRIYTLDEFKARERRVAGSGSEFRHALRHTLAAFDRGWRYGELHSAVEPDAMPDDTHVAVMVKITRADYEAAQAAGWPVRSTR